MFNMISPLPVRPNWTYPRCNSQCTQQEEGAGRLGFPGRVPSVLPRLPERHQGISYYDGWRALGPDLRHDEGLAGGCLLSGLR